VKSLSARIFFSLTVIATVALVSACDTGLSGNPLKGPYTLVNIRVLVHNSTGTEFTVVCQCLLPGNKASIAYGSAMPIRTISDSNPLQRIYTFDITRRDVALARVSYRVAKFPTPIKGKLVSQDVKIVVREPSSGTFSAATADPLWIQVLGTTSLSSSGI
jgi:hypothetical protein